MFLFSNKLDLNQETRFTILVYSTGFRITLPALNSKSETKRLFQKLSHNQDLHPLTLKTTFKHTSWTNNKFSTSNKFNPSNQRSKATMTQLTWPDKFRPTPMSP